MALHTVYDGHTVADKFFWDIADGDEVVIEMLWEFLAYIMLPTCEAKCFFVMADAPDSGKSKFLEFVRASYAKGTVSDGFSPQTWGEICNGLFSRCKGKCFNGFKQ